MGVASSLQSRVLSYTTWITAISEETHFALAITDLSTTFCGLPILMILGLGEPRRDKSRTSSALETRFTPLSLN